MLPGSSFLALAIFVGVAVTLNIQPRVENLGNGLVRREPQGYGGYDSINTSPTTTYQTGAVAPSTSITSTTTCSNGASPPGSTSTIASSAAASSSPTISSWTSTATSASTSTVTSNGQVTTAVGPTPTSMYVAPSEWSPVVVSVANMLKPDISTASKGNGTFTTGNNYTMPHATSTGLFNSSANALEGRNWVVALIAGAGYLVGNTIF